jgi:hypothetical protein
VRRRRSSEPRYPARASPHLTSRVTFRIVTGLGLDVVLLLMVAYGECLWRLMRRTQRALRCYVMWTVNSARAAAGRMATWKRDALMHCSCVWARQAARTGPRAVLVGRNCVDGRPDARRSRHGSRAGRRRRWYGVLSPPGSLYGPRALACAPQAIPTPIRRYYMKNMMDIREESQK